MIDMNIGRKFVPESLLCAPEFIQHGATSAENGVIPTAANKILAVISQITSQIKLFIRNAEKPINVYVNEQLRKKIAPETPNQFDLIMAERFSLGFEDTNRLTLPKFEDAWDALNIYFNIDQAQADVAKKDDAMGGIDFAQKNLLMNIRRDGNGVPLPISQQNLETLNFDGLVPMMISIRSAATLPMFNPVN